MKTLAIVCLVVATLASTFLHAASNVIQYTYDAVGNIVAIRRVGAAPVVVAEVTPASDSIRRVVTITGFAPAAGAPGSPASAKANVRPVAQPANGAMETLPAEPSPGARGAPTSGIPVGPALAAR